MKTALWAGVLALAALWPARLAGPLDGAPLNTPLEAVVIGALLPVAVWLAPRIFELRSARCLIVALLAWKALTAAVLVQDGWCLRFTSPVALFVEDLRVPHSWDIRADWRRHPPRCSAIMATSYRELEEFPAWFFNLPPANFRNPVSPIDRPPLATPALNVDGYLRVGNAGLFSVAAGEDVPLTATIDGRPVDAAQLAQGILITPGIHMIALAANLERSHWSLEPKWNGADLWRGFAASATVAAPRAIDAWFRPWGSSVAALLLILIVALAVREIAARAADAIALGWAVTVSAAMMAIAMVGYNPLTRIAPVLSLAVLALKPPQRLRTPWGAGLLVGVPFLTLFVALHAGEAPLFSWYTSGDDWWMFQRFAYRIYLQDFWLEGGEPTFWFQPLYRWVAGALHLVFGDSSVGEFLWDAAAAVVGAMFAFRVTLMATSFRWAVTAATLTLTLFTAGPAWYLFGRGLSEITSMGLIYAAALCALRARERGPSLALAAGLLAALGFLARLNNLPFALAIVAFALPLQVPASLWWRPQSWLGSAARPVALGVLGAMAIGLWLFTARTYYFTGVPSMLHGTQAGLLTVWQTTREGGTPLSNLWGSVLMVVTMSDPPRLEPRALPIVAGVAAAILSLGGVRRFRELPLNVSVFAMAGIAGAFVARGSAYPGRFSIHLIPVTVALTVSAVWLVTRRRAPAPSG